MPVYQVQAAKEGRAVIVATVDTANHAIIKFLDALEEYGRAWVQNASGDDVPMDELTRLAAEEQRG